MATSVMFVLCAAVLVTVVSAAPSTPSTRNTIRELVDVIEEYRPLFDSLARDKDDFFQSAKASFFTAYRLMNEEVLQNLGNTRNAIEYGFDGLRTDIAAEILDGGDEDCLLNLVGMIRDEERSLAAGMSSCSAFTGGMMDDVSNSFYTTSRLLNVLTISFSEYVMWSFEVRNSVLDPQEHADNLRYTYDNSRATWEDSLMALFEYQYSAIELNMPFVIDDNFSCLDALVQTIAVYEDSIRQQMQTCVEPF